MRFYPLIALGWALGPGAVAFGSAPSNPAGPETAGPANSVSLSPAEIRWRRPSVAAVRVAEGPVVDGRLDDAVWDLAPVGGPLHEAYQQPGQLMSERTEFRVLYDEKNLYLGIWCFDTEPERIIAREMEHDGNITDDYCYVLLDTFLDRRNGYLFTVEPLGARSESLITANTVVNRDWDGLWWARTSRDAEGWKVEMAIPFKTLSFNPANTTWGLNVERQIRRKFEIGRWASPRREVSGYMPSAAGTLTGLEGLKQGLGLEFSPYLKGRYGGDPDREAASGDLGGEVRYRLTPYLSSTLSYNTDFAETEADLRQINFTRFPLFFPEKRAFFLEDSGIFEYGGLSGSRLGRALVPYFSRRIGLAEDGAPVPILVAGKLAGRVGNYNLGLLDAVLDEQPGLEQRNVFVGRLSRNVLEQSSIGALATVGDPNAEANNVMAGPDFNFRTSQFLGRRTLQGHLFALGSWSEPRAVEAGYAYGLNLRYPNDPWEVQVEYMEIDEGFHPALGYV
ncbi:MAG: carbohydrate binding family 9 domain-containing protein, partial [Verrucomicrobia bacterium]|nr:carbohydrate binding family 9 domain-containing protein [Verrucomicrobiota bacterium]